MGQLYGSLTPQSSRFFNQQGSAAQLLNHAGYILAVQVVRRYLGHLRALDAALLLQCLYDIGRQRGLAIAALAGDDDIAKQRIVPAFFPHPILFQEGCQLLVHAPHRGEVCEQLLLLLGKLSGGQGRYGFFQILFQVVQHGGNVLCLCLCLFLFRL